MSTQPKIVETSAKPSRLGRGLMDLIGEQAIAAGPVEAGKEAANLGPSVEIPIDAITPNPKQPRRVFNEKDLIELSNSVKSKGIIQAILVRPDPEKDGQYQIVAGERRWRAAQRVGLKSIPAVVRKLDDLEILEIGIIENVQRANLNPIEEAEAYYALVKRFGHTQDVLAEQVGKSRSYIANSLRLLNLPEDARQLMMQDDSVTAGHARAALSAPDPMIVIDEVLNKGLSVRQAEKFAQQLRIQESGVGSAMRQSKTMPDDEDVDTKALEIDLAEKLGLDVEIRRKKDGRGGELRIRYRKLEQLDELCRRLSSGRKNI